MNPSLPPAPQPAPSLPRALLACLCAFGAAAAAAQSPPAKPQGQNLSPQSAPMHQPRRAAGPPPQALAACEGSSYGAACSFPGSDGKPLLGTCFSPAPSGPLALSCRPLPPSRPTAKAAPSGS